MGVGEHFILGFRGILLPPWVAAFEREFGLGGVILFDRDVATGSSSRNIESPTQLQALCDEVHALGSRPLIFVDQEGGAVRRLKPSHGFVDLPSHRTLASLDDDQRLAVLTASFAEMKALGIDFNLAPVIDLDTNPENPNIGRLGRSLSADPQIVRRCATSFGDAAKTTGLQLCVKHYPGLGGATVDSHDDQTDIGDTISDQEIALFTELSSGLFGRSILLSHGMVKQWDAARPVSISSNAVNRIRTGVHDLMLITDDVQMNALRQFATLEAATLEAVRAGVDLVCVGNNLRAEENGCFTAAALLREAVDQDPELKRQSRAALRRIGSRKVAAVRIPETGENQ